MRLTAHTDYSLRVLMYLNKEKRLITLKELSTKLNISRNNLIKVSNQLSKQGYIETSQGRGGGLTIKTDAAKTSIKDIICETEENFHMAECFSAKACDCTFIKSCLLKKSLKEALDVFLGSLEKITIDDVTR